MAKAVLRDSVRVSERNLPRRMLVSLSLDLGSYTLFQIIERVCKKRGLDVEEVRSCGLG